jgi:formate hydrogenlyase transcriptional activator
VEPNNDDLLAAFWKSSHLGFASVDAEMRYRTFSPGFAEMTGVSVEAGVGKTVREVLGDAADCLEPVLRRVLESDQPETNVELAGTLPAKAETVRWNGHCFPIKNSGGVVKQVALVTEGAGRRERLGHLKSDLAPRQMHCDRLKSLLEFATLLMPDSSEEEVRSAIAVLVKTLIDQDYASLSLYNEKLRQLQIWALDSTLAKQTIGELIGKDGIVDIRAALSGTAFLRGDAVVLGPELLTSGHPVIVRLREAGLKSLCFIPMITSKGALGTLNLGSRQPDRFGNEEMEFLKFLAVQVAIVLHNAASHREITELTKKLKQEKLYLEDEIRSAHNFEEIVGDSQALEGVLDQVGTVAPSDATVLILGETGTGKELIARAIHRLSLRKDASFIKMNCAAIPTGLLESELFGHEKGAFTGAISQKIGRLELADRGTLFLDEVGEIPLELQPKLLRVLQDLEFERLGGTRTIKVNLRLIAATNRDLAKSVASNQFRSDLFYRLHVFPIRVPPLRERGRDIPLLVRYFVKKFSHRMGKPIETIPTEVMDALCRWNWPGNVRELENFIERAVILSKGKTLMAPLAELKSISSNPVHDSNLENLERQHILRVLQETGGVIAGVHGAAVRLGMKRTTLQSRMQKLGITREDYQN